MIRGVKILFLASLSGLAAVHAVCQTWVQTGAPSNSWVSIVCSADGSKLIAPVTTRLDEMTITGSFLPGPIYISTNSGTSWMQTGNLTNVWNNVACSADGTRMAVVAGFDGIYVSTNSGGAWFLTTLPAHFQYWSSVAFSANGKKVAAAASSAVNGAEIYISTNSGVDWTPTSAPSSISNYWPVVVSSADGCKLAAISQVEDSSENVTSSIYISINSGATWVQVNAPNEQWNYIAISADGTKLIAGVGYASLFLTSTNCGADWISNNFEGVDEIVSSADQTKLAGVKIEFIKSGFKFLTTNQVVRSTDSGLTWNSIAVPPGTNGFGIASSSADGNKLFAIANGYIYVWQATPSPQLNLAVANTNLTLSWIIPATNFALQQSSDLSVWIDLTNVPILNFSNLQNQITLPQSDGNGFYRLKTE